MSEKSFEERLADVEAMIGEMEAGGLPLDETVRRYERGMHMIAALEKELAGAAQRLTVLTHGPDGDAEEPLEDEP
ncbi:MAG: exodeoxyribonuclease VII small subunit [Clostridia bacterium]|nr:exodeoxyribonuclease VII small subunit [Clostridia bacterium]